LHEEDELMSIYLTQCRHPALIGALMMFSSFLLDGCASSRLIKHPLPPTDADVSWAGSAPEGLAVEVHQLIFRNTGGSWVRNANWDEYVLTVKNDSQYTLELQEINLYSGKLPAPVQSSTSREQLDARSNSTLRAMKDVGIVAGVGIVAPSAMIVGAVGTSGGILSASAAGATAATIGVIAIPVGLIGGTVYVINRHHRDKEDNVLIQGILNERGFSLPLQIPPGMQVQKSAFFPVTPAPTRLVVSETIDGNASDISIELPALTQLHLKPLRSAITPDSVPRV
jgi:hypothetical protein